MVSANHIEHVALSLLEAYDSGEQLAPVSESLPELDTATAYRISHRITALREHRGEQRVGYKIGFTNRTIWPLYNVSGPMWGPVWNTTLHDLSGKPVELPNLPQKRLEPEIVFGLQSSIHPEMPLKDVAECIDWISLGFEIVFCPFPGWQFTAADSAAAFGLHAALFTGPKQRFVPDMATALSEMRVELTGPEHKHLSGSGSDVLGGPLQALGFLLDTLAADPNAPDPAEGQVVTTGTLTDAVPITCGERWSAQVEGIDLPDAQIAFL